MHRSEHGAEIPIGFPRNFVYMPMNVVHQIPISFFALRGQTIDVHGSVHRPGMDICQRIIFINVAHLILVMLLCRREQNRLHERAEGAFQIVKINDGDKGMVRAANGSTQKGNSRQWIFAQIKFFQVRQGVVVCRNQKIHRLRAPIVLEGHGQRIEAGNSTLAAFSNYNDILRWHVELGTNR